MGCFVVPPHNTPPPSPRGARATPHPQPPLAVPRAPSAPPLSPPPPTPRDALPPPPPTQPPPALAAAHTGHAVLTERASGRRSIDRMPSVQRRLLFRVHDARLLVELTQARLRSGVHREHTEGAVRTLARRAGRWLGHQGRERRVGD